MTRQEIIEYCLTLRFWAVVANILPNYKERQIRLKDLQKRLDAEDWE